MLTTTMVFGRVAYNVRLLSAVAVLAALLVILFLKYTNCPLFHSSTTAAVVESNCCSKPIDSELLYFFYIPAIVQLNTAIFVKLIESYIASV
jgi:hypothetical protein